MKQDSRFDEVRSVFEELYDTPPPMRRARLQTLAREDEWLHDEVESLLRHADSACNSLDDAPARIDELLGELADAGTSATEAPPPRIGHYAISDVLGQGGMGVVYRARQTEPVEREVAIKLVRPGMATASLLARFEAERRALASMNHPNIAAMYDAGVTDEPGGGRPYFVMQCVPGRPITNYCDEHQLDIESRLRLFSSVCEAVQHAHRRGVIHRDLKPSNVLVETVDGRPVPRIIDFGIAKAMQHDDDGAIDRATTTMPGMLLGAPLYMSPEQADHGAAQVDTRSDVYSLGVMLYELLCGCTPIDAEMVRHTSSSELAGLIRTHQPLSPSEALASSSPASRGATAAARACSPRELARVLRGELSWMAMKALAKEPSRRYESPGDLVEDIRRHARGLAVEAGPPGFRYRARRFLTRHRFGVLAASVVLLAIAACVTGVLLQARHTRREMESGRRVSRFLHDVLASTEPRYALGAAPTLRDVLDRASQRLQHEPDLTPVTKARLHNTIGATYFGLGAFESAESHWRAALDLFIAFAGEASAETIKVMANLSLALSDRGAGAEAEALSLRAVNLAARHLPPAASERRQASMNRAVILDRADRDDEAEALYREMLAIERASNDDRGIVIAMSNLGGLLSRRNRADDARAMLTECVAHARRTIGADHPASLTAMQNLGAFLQQRSPAEAVALMRETVERSQRVLGPDHRDTIAWTRDLVLCLMSAGMFDEAENIARSALEASQLQFGGLADLTANLNELLAASIGLQGRLDESLALAKAWHESLVSSVGDDHPVTRRAARLIAEAYDSMGNDVLEAHWRDVAGQAPAR